MSKFKFNVGDRVRWIRNYEHRTGGLGPDSTGVVSSISSYGDVRLGGAEYGYSPDCFELIEPFELEQLRQFKADAIAKYPDLAPMSEDDEWLLQMYNKEFKANRTTLPASSSFIDGLRLGIQWGRDHAAN